MKYLKLSLRQILILVLCVAAHAQIQSDRDKANLRGAVKSVREMSDPSGPRSGKGDLVEYDDLGNEIRREMVSDFGEPMGTLVREVKPTGLTYKVELFSPEGVKTAHTNYVYHLGKLVNIQNFDIVPKKFRDLAAMTYDSSGFLIQESYMIVKDFEAKTLFENDDQGRPIEMAFFKMNGQKMIATIGPCLGAHKVVLTYDKKGRPVTKTVFDVDGSEKKRWAYSYDENDNYREQVIRSPSSMTRIRFVYEYDQSRNWVTRTTETSTDDGVLQKMLEATGKKATQQELEEFKKASKRISVTRREITYH